MSINNFGPFEADKWGTVSDWAMVIVTGITGLLIWLTLRSQLRSQQLQSKLTQIEINRFKKENKPEFTLMNPDIKDINYKNGVVSLENITLTFTISSNLAKGVEIRSQPYGEGWQGLPESKAISTVASNEICLAFKLSRPGFKKHF